MLRNGFLTVLGLVRNDLGRILKGPKSADFEQKLWAMAHAFAENGGFWWVPEIVPNSMKRRLYASKWISYCFGTCSKRFGTNSQGSEIADFKQKAWAIVHGFENGGFW